ncbi:organelle RRM domain-containing protein 2, mitochondrial [Andrographis paniculata]|uniref:organelle RRM domain-containing protein 2, mitochondrial n=1 Tax=Andrographis paniculata TaxID=175694 RepID=UPI0021E91132|nr:organelle RRM domain-containing protein 2, mitochondrial [Andrographis paniculata]XP_051130716.1 organelle RRM domain-containing protein 2, mitochondrial [Andrographis paniculata]
MALVSAFRRILSGSSAPAVNVRSHFASIRFNSTNSTIPTLTSPKLFVSGLSRNTTDENLYKAFAPFGRLLEAKVIVDRGSGRSKGFGFVTYGSIEEAEKAREGMNAKFLDGWVIFVDPARNREAQPRPPPRQEMQSTETMGFTTNKTVGWSGPPTSRY